MTWLQIVSYVLIALCIVIYVARLAKYARMPIHIRWELYPLAGDKNRPLGGSYLEDREWWNAPREEKSFVNEMKFMGEEVLFFKEYKKHNPSYWYHIFPFHIGIFSFMGFAALLFAGAVTRIFGMDVSAVSPNLWSKFLYYITPVFGGIALILGTLGSAAILVKRVIDMDLKPYTRRIEYFNLVLVLVVFLAGLLSWIFYDKDFAVGRQYIFSLMSLSGVADISPLTTASILLLLVTAAYLPYTNMMHFFAKWFTYHKIRWDDAPNLRGGNLENKLSPQLELPLSWSASHAGELGRWSDIAHEGDHAEPQPRVKKGASID